MAILVDPDQLNEADSRLMATLSISFTPGPSWLISGASGPGMAYCGGYRFVRNPGRFTVVCRQGRARRAIASRAI